ncbi:HTH-type transcriptional regulator GltC [Paraburkholderia haematera]|uniref:HTH-type transcriptional regulator GltC n=2 Tax=Paraburkholderia haematera TaxID=2793077 RepID=A0ABM8SAW1_9BURK|nr:HTH-type transcriptional regulator GltC [Paraburkholderia haematera]
MLTWVSTNVPMKNATEQPRETGPSTLSARSLRYLHEIEIHGGVRAAADALGINASVISRQVSQLEREYGVILLERRGRRVALTEVGLGLVEHYRESCRRDAQMLAQLEDYRGLRRGRLGVGVGDGRMETLIATVLEPFSVQFPDITIELRSGTITEIVTMVRNGEVDLGLCTGGGNDPAIRARTFRGAPYRALVSPHHPLAAKRTIRFKQLQGERLIFMPTHYNVQQYIDSILRAERLNLTPSYRCDQFSAAQAIAAAGLGVAFMSTDAARLYLEAGKLVSLEIDHPVAREFNSQVIRRVGGRLSPAAEALWKQLIQAMKGR